MCKDKEDFTLLEWNINQKAGAGNTSLSESIIKEILNKQDNGQPPDIVVLTEFYKSHNWEAFKKRFKETGYCVFCSCLDAKHGYNQVLIAIRKESGIVADKTSVKEPDALPRCEGCAEPICKIYCKKSRKPNFMRIDAMLESKKLSIIGIRVRCPKMSEELQAKSKISQIQTINEYLNAIDSEHVITVGDFNYKMNYRPNCYDLPLHNALFADTHSALSGAYRLVTPIGFSYKGEGSYVSDLDHIVTKNVTISNAEYSWSFEGKGAAQSDHAMLLAKFALD